MRYLGRSTLVTPVLLGDLNNVDLTTVAAVLGDLLRYNGTNWVKIAQGAGGGLDADTVDGIQASGFATAAQGGKADSAIQPGANVTTLGSGTANSGTVLTANGTGGLSFQTAPVVSVAGRTGAVTLAVADVANATPDSRTLTAGDGLTGGGTLAANRTFTLGTPGTLTTASTNAVTTTSHTHAVTFPVTSVASKTGAVSLAVADVLNATPDSRTLTAGDGLVGGGNLTANRTFTLGTPGTLTTSSTNAVSAESHTHAVTFPVTSVASKTGAVTLAVADVANAVADSRSISTNNGLTGGGNLTADRTLGLTGQALALHNLATNGVIARTGAGTVAARTITAGTGITVSNGDGAAGNPTVTNSAPHVATNLTATGGTTAGPVINSSTGTGVTIPSASGTASGVVTTGAQTFAGVKTFNSTITGSISGNAGTVTNGVYTSGDQTIGGTKTFSSTITGNISGNAGTVTNGVYTSGDQTIAGAKTFSGEIIANGQVRLPPTTLGTTGTINIDFAGASYRTQAALTGAVTYTASNYAAGRSVTIRVTNGATLRTLTFPTNWKFVGAKPADIAVSKVGILTVTSFGTTEADCVAAWAVEA